MSALPKELNFDLQYLQTGIRKSDRKISNVIKYPSDNKGASSLAVQTTDCIMKSCIDHDKLQVCMQNSELPTCHSEILHIVS